MIQGNHPIFKQVKVEKIQNDSPSENYVASKETQKTRGILTGEWTQQEKLVFVIYIHIHENLFNQKLRRKNLQVFKKLAEFLGTRTAQQCRSHFQKTRMKFKTLAQLRNDQKSLLGEQKYEEEYRKVLDQLRLFNQDSRDRKDERRNGNEEYGAQTEDCVCVTEEWIYEYFQRRVQEQMMKTTQFPNLFQGPPYFFRVYS